jgi:uncharacterized protein YndB with AHSA1/START domain
MSKAPDHVYVTYIKTTPERLWQALTDGSVTKKYYFSGTVKSDWKKGSRYLFTGPKGEDQIEGAVVEADPPRKLVTTFHAVWDEEIRKDPPTLVTFEIEPMLDVCKLTVVHSGLEAGSETDKQTGGGWAMILSSLKSLLETGDGLSVTQPEEASV